MAAIVDSLKREHDAIVEFLREQSEPSFVIAMEATASKVLLLAGASHLEQELQEALAEYYKEVTGGEVRAVEFVRNKAMARQYHTLFDWEASNANRFFSLFGTEFKRLASEIISEDGELESNVSDFLQLGSLRNQLVHQNYAAFVLNKTTDEIYALYKGAEQFVERLPALLRQEARD